MEEQNKEIDWTSPSDILDAAKPFDLSYTQDRPVMLAGTEIVAFVRYHMAPRTSAGRRAADTKSVERVRDLEQENALLKAQNSMLMDRIMKDRRKQELHVNVERRNQGEKL